MVSAPPPSRCPRKMVYDRVEAEKALLRYYNTTSGGKTGKKQVGPLWEALAMVRAGFGVAAEPFLQVRLKPCL